MVRRIAIHSVPRSGSTWVGEIFNSSPEIVYKFQPLFSYEFKGYLSDKSLKKDVLDFYLKISNARNDFLDRTKERDRGLAPIFSKCEIHNFTVYKEVRYHNILENLLSVDDDLILVGIIRNPLAVINSWLNAPREFRADLGWDQMKEWRKAPSKNMSRPEESFGFDKWKEFSFLVHALRDMYPDRVYIINYAKLLADTMNEVCKVFDFCNLPCENQTIEFLSSSRTTRVEDVYSVYNNKKSDDAWKNELNCVIRNEIVCDLKGTCLYEYLEM